MIKKKGKARLYYIWEAMRKRCNNPKHKSYRDYGLKGIAYCKSWDKYAVFKKWAMRKGFKVGLCIDRINHKLGYKPSNCRWVTRDDSNAFRFGVDLRKTCKRGHPWKKETTYFYPETRKCKICQSFRNRRNYQLRRNSK